MAIVWLVVVVDVVAAGGAVRASAGSRRGHAHIRGLGTPRPLFVARPLSKVERGHPGVGAQATDRGVVCASRECSDRLANRNGFVSQCSVSVPQRELVSLLRVVGTGVGSGLVVVQVAISQQ